MSSIRDSASALQTMRGIAFRDGGGTLRTAKAAFARDAGNTLRPLFSGLTVSLSPDYVSGSGNAPGSVRIKTGNTYSTVVGGAAPFTYVWTLGDDLWTALGPAAPYTNFRSPALDSGSESTTSAYLSITDANGATAVSNTITVYGVNF